jgi:hypothetical protein
MLSGMKEDGAGPGAALPVGGEAEAPDVAAGGEPVLAAAGGPAGLDVETASMVALGA